MHVFASFSSSCLCYDACPSSSSSFDVSDAFCRSRRQHLPQMRFDQYRRRRRQCHFCSTSLMILTVNVTSFSYCAASDDVPSYSVVFCCAVHYEIWRRHPTRRQLCSTFLRHPCHRCESLHTSQVLERLYHPPTLFPYPPNLIPWWWWWWWQHYPFGH